MNHELVATFIILGSAMVLFLTERLPVDLVALLVVAALGVSGVLTPQEAFSGFSRSAIIIIVAILVLADGIERTGVCEQVGKLLVRVAGQSESRLVTTTMSAAAFLSLGMNNIAAAAVLLPAVVSAGRKSGVPRSRLLMPLAFGTLLGGMATWFTTTNIVSSSLLRQQGLRGFGLLDFAAVGLPLAIIGVLYMAIWGRHLLPLPTADERLQRPRETPGDLAEVYELGDYLFQAQVPTDSPLIGRQLAAGGFRKKYGVTVIGLKRDAKTVLLPAPSTIFEAGDILVLAGEMEEMLLRDAAPDLEILPLTKWQHHDLENESVCLAEAMLSPRSRLMGQTLRTTHFLEKYGMTVLAVWRAGRRIYVGLQDLELEFGDALLLQAPRERLRLLQRDPDLILLTSREGWEAVPVKGKGWLALSIFAGTVAVAAIGPFPVAEVMLCGALVMVLLRVLTMEQVYQSIEWRLVFLVAGMLPLGIAMVKTGAAAVMSHWLVALLGPLGPVALLAGLMVLTISLSQAMKGAAVATVMIPIAVQSAQQMGVDPRALAMGVTLATSMAFVTPLGHPVNILVMGEGGYEFRDFFKVGLPLTLLLLVVVMLLLPVFWPLHPR